MRALIVDSNAADTAKLAEYLCRGGYTPVSVTSVQQARLVLARQSFDLLLLEIELPDGSGLRLCAEVRKRLAGRLVIIFVSIRDTPLQRVTAIQLGADDFVGKPVDAEELLARIEVCRRRIG